MRYTLLFLCCFSFLSLSSQDYVDNIRTLNMSDGLTHYKVESFLEGKNGMWIGTADGLNFYDGFSWKYWKKEDHQINFEKVNLILNDQNDHLWLFNIKWLEGKKYLQCIDILSPESKQTVSFSDFFGDEIPFKFDSIQQFFQDQENRIYIFAADQLWSYSSKSSFQPISLPKGFEPFKIFNDGTLVGHSSGSIVLVSNKGEILFDTGYQTKENLRFQIQGDYTTFIISQPENKCIQYKLQQDGSYTEIDFSSPDDPMELRMVMGYDPKREWFWLYKDTELHVVDTTGRSILNFPYNSRIACIDRNGNTWLGGKGVAVIKLTQQKFRRYLHQQKYNNDETVESYKCRGLIEKNDVLFAGTYSGLKKIDLKTGSFSTFGREDRKFVTFKDKQNHLWFANRVLQRYDQSDSFIAEEYRKAEEVDKDRIWDIIEDHEGKIWIGDHGISYLENGIIKPFTKYNDFPQLEKSIVLDLFKDKNGVIWVASVNGLYILDSVKGIINGFGKFMDAENYLPTNKFQHIYQDAEGIYWLATEDVGLIRWNRVNGDWKVFEKEHGFLSNNIYSVYEDDYGYLWMSSFNGLIQMHKKQGKVVNVFTEEDGISYNEFNRISHFQADDGRLFFGGQNGVTALDPKDFTEEDSLSSSFHLKVEHINVFGERIFRDSLHNGDPIELKELGSGVRVIDLELYCSDLFWAADLELHYVLERLNNRGDEVVSVSRNNISSDNHIELFGMTPGNYLLKVKAIQKSGKQKGETLMVPINIAVPFTQTLIFKLGAVALLSILVFGVLKIRTDRLRRRKLELEKLVKERTAQILKDEKTIKSQAEQIAEMREQLSRKDEEWLEQLKSIISERLEDSNLDLPAIIENLDIGRSQFFEKVKSLTNMTPNQYIQELRLTKAKDILESGDVKTVKEVSFAVGISRPGYFSKLFKDRFGILPSEYFRRHNN